MATEIVNDVASPIAQVVFAHGAGADMHHEFMEQVTLLLNEADINVLRFNFPYMDKRIEFGKRYPPDRMPTLIECYQSIVNHLVSEQKSTLPLFIGGKSMGSRVAVTLAENTEISTYIQGVFCLGYPFHPAKKVDKLRLEPLQLTNSPVLIVQGERDTLGSKDEISDYDISPLCQCVFLPDGDHSLKPRVKSGFTHQQHIERAVFEIIQFIKKALLI